MENIKRNVVFDAHADTLEVAWRKQIPLTDSRLDICMQEVQNQLPYIQCFAAYIDPKLDQVPDGGYQRACDIIAKYEQEYENLKKEGIPITTIVSPDQLEKVIANQEFGVILTVENGTAISGNLEHISHLYEKGIRVMSLTWNEDNELACGAMTEEDTGLTPLGKRCVQLMNQFGMMVDVSHLSYKSFFDVIACTKKPIIATHSGVERLAHHRRNLTDRQITEIGKQKGMIGVPIVNAFLREDGNATSEDMVNHIIHIANLIGIDHVGIGTDFDGLVKDSEYTKDIHTIKDIRILEEKMRARGFQEEEIVKVMGQNYVHFFEENM